MNRIILNRIKSSIKHNLEDKASQIIYSSGTYLSKRDLSSLIRYMNKIKTYSVSVIRYIYYVSPHRHVFNPIEHNKLLYQTYGYPAIIDLLWNDNRVVQEYLRIVHSGNIFDHGNVLYAARCVLTNGTSRSMQILINNEQIRSPYILNRALERAAEKGYADIVSLLFERFSSVLSEQSCSYSLSTASHRGFDDVVSILLKFCAKVSHDALDGAMRGACFGMVCGRDLKTVRLLLEDLRSDPASCSNTPIYYACTAGNPNPAIVMLLLQDERVDPSKRDTHPIRVATNFEIIRILFEDGRYDAESCVRAIRNLIRRNIDEDELKKIIALPLTNKYVLPKLRLEQESSLENVIAFAKKRYPDVASMLIDAVKNENIETC